MRDHFLFRKNEQLKKDDKSLKGSWDAKIENLCNRINKLDDYYTTSSCSGRILILEEAKEKRDDLFSFCSHYKVDFEDMKKVISEIKSEKLLYFRQDPCILHVSCRSLEHAQKIHDLAKDSGWKRCGIIASKNRFVVELNGTQRIEVPVMKEGNLLINDELLDVLIDEANRKLEISWELIEKFEEKFTS